MRPLVSFLPIKTLTQHTVSNTFFFIMSKQVLLSLLAQGNNGSELLSILDAIVADNVTEGYDNEPTADVIDF